VAPFRPQLPRWAIPDEVRDRWPAATPGDANEVIKVRDDGDKFEVTLDVSHYRPEDLKVSTVNNVLSIEGKHEEDEKHAAEGCAR
jgi:HSP20 family molecular chaperone IbpA